jgi:photosystem II stability/assembly factor-like uncharacterized protein
LVVRSFLTICSILLICATAWAEQWTSSGPNGGDVRSLAADPWHADHILLGTSTGTIFQSNDGGRSWSYFVHLGRYDDNVVDHIVFDPSSPGRLYVAAWSLRSHHSGDLFRSLDGGKSWKNVPAMHGKSIRTLTIDAKSRVLIAGALDGVYCSKDNGLNWHRISGTNRAIKNVESAAIDPSNPNIVYAGTWHLAWKTVDGGNTWHRIERGMIDDSDIFSILVDESDPHVIFASACSGIYKSENRGGTFERVQEIPFSARRTRVLRQDPTDPAVVYAGTTEGLWVTKDSGGSWKRVTSPDLVVNDILVDPRTAGRVLLATDRAGVLVSVAAQLDFSSSNEGFTHRYVSSALIDEQHPDTLFAGVVNDREFGGVFFSNDSGRHWIQKSDGLDGRDVFALKQTVDGQIVAGTNQGLFGFDRDTSQWVSLGPGAQTISAGLLPNARVNDIDTTSSNWLMATPGGLYSSSDDGKSWSQNHALGNIYIVSVQRHGAFIVVATPRNVLISNDNGHRWRSSTKVLRSEEIRSLTVTSRDIIVVNDKGAFRSSTLGRSWAQLKRPSPQQKIGSIHYDEIADRLLASVEGSTTIFESRDSGRTWHRAFDTGYELRQITGAGPQIVALTKFEGVIVTKSQGADLPETLGSTR